MGNIGFPELLVILVVAFLFLGPKRLPDVARALGEAVRAFRQALHETAYDPKPLPPEPPSLTHEKASAAPAASSDQPPAPSTESHGA